MIPISAYQCDNSDLLLANIYFVISHKLIFSKGPIKYLLLVIEEV